jgi:hypothetical protein
MEMTHIVSVLADLRKTVEAEADMPATEIEVTLAAVLDDVCRALYLGPSQAREVLGAEAFSAVHSCEWASGTQLDPTRAIPVTLPEADPWAELRAKVKRAYAKSQNVVIDDPTDPSAAFRAAFCPEKVQP